MNLRDPEEFINRRRRQMHVHSIIYYHLHTNLIDDATFDRWAVELAAAQKQFPEYLHQGYMWTVFQNWTGDTGMHLPMKDDVQDLATRLLADAQKRNHTVTPMLKKSAQNGSEKVNVVGWERD